MKYEAASMTTAKSTSWAADGTRSASRAPRKVPSMATGAKVSTARPLSSPLRRRPRAPAALVTPTTARLMAIDGFTS